MGITAKRWLRLAIAVTAATLVASCGTSKSPQDTGAEYTAPSAGEVLTEPVEPASESWANTENLPFVTGVIVYFDGATLIVCSEDYRNLNFLVADEEVDKSGTGGLAKGSMVDVYYDGMIEGSNTSAVQVARLMQNDAQAKVRTDINLIGGIVSELGGDFLAITTFDGESLTLRISEDTDKSNAQELEAGDFVTAFYSGDVADDATDDAVAVRLVR